MAPPLNTDWRRGPGPVVLIGGEALWQGGGRRDKGAAAILIAGCPFVWPHPSVLIDKEMREGGRASILFLSRFFGCC